MSLELKAIEKKVGEETHIYQTDLRFEKNTINVLLGSTLAGKTTLMQIMAGLDKPTSGEIWFNEKNELDERSLFVATPVHSEVSIHYTQSLLELQKQAIKKKIKIVFQLYKSSLVTQGRNLCVSAFLRSGLPR